MYCKKCGTQIPDASRFCRNCGTEITPLRPPAETNPPDEGTVRVRPAQKAPMPEDGTMRVRPAQKTPMPKPAPARAKSPQNPPKKKARAPRRGNQSTAVVIGVCIVLIVAALAALGIFVVAPLFAPSEKASSTPTPTPTATPQTAARTILVGGDGESVPQSITAGSDGTQAEDYAAAQRLLESGEYEAAADAFEQLNDYADAAERSRSARYAYAREKMDEKAYDVARDQFLLLGDYEDAPERADRCMELLTIILNSVPHMQPTDDDCGQFVLAELSGSSAVLTYYEKTPVGWELIYSFDATAGKNGISYSKTEGDNCTPAGEYDLLFYFGETTPVTDFTYIETDSDSVFVDDSASPFYNTLQLDNNGSWSSCEDLHTRYFGSGQYSNLIYIGYNGDGRTAGSATAGRGSMVTICGKTGTLSATGGCIDIAAYNLSLLLVELDPAENPVIIITEAR